MHSRSGGAGGENGGAAAHLLGIPHEHSSQQVVIGLHHSPHVLRHHDAAERVLGILHGALLYPRQQLLQAPVKAAAFRELGVGDAHQHFQELAEEDGAVGIVRPVTSRRFLCAVSVSCVAQTW